MIEGPPLPGGKVRKRKYYPRNCPREFRHYAVDDALRDEHRVDYESLILKSSTTTDEALAWLRARGYELSRSTVWRHRRSFQLEMKDLRRASRIAAEVTRINRTPDGGGTNLTEATQTRFEQMMMERLFDPAKPALLNPDQWLEMSKAVAEMVASRRAVEDVRHEFATRARAAAAEIKKACKENQTPEEQAEAFRRTADRVRKILGMPTDEEWAEQQRCEEEEEERRRQCEEGEGQSGAGSQ